MAVLEKCKIKLAEKMAEEVTYKKQHMAEIALSLINRKIVKRPIMTIPYGVSITDTS